MSYDHISFLPGIVLISSIPSLESVIINCLISGGIPVILRSSGDGKTVEISSRGEQNKTDTKTSDDLQPSPSPANPEPGPCSQVEEFTTEARRERGSMSGQSSNTGSTRQIGQNTGQVRNRAAGFLALSGA